MLNLRKSNMYLSIGNVCVGSLLSGKCFRMNSDSQIQMIVMIIFDFEITLYILESQMYESFIF